MKPAAYGGARARVEGRTLVDPSDEDDEVSVTPSEDEQQALCAYRQPAVNVADMKLEFEESPANKVEHRAEAPVGPRARLTRSGR